MKQSQVKLSVIGCSLTTTLFPLNAYASKDGGAHIAGVAAFFIAIAIIWLIGLAVRQSKADKLREYRARWYAERDELLVQTVQTVQTEQAELERKENLVREGKADILSNYRQLVAFITVFPVENVRVDIR